MTSLKISTNTPPRPKATNFSETGIGQRADDHFVATCQHLLHEDPIEFRHQRL